MSANSSVTFDRDALPFAVVDASAPLLYDPLQLEDDPYPIYRRLRDEAPLYAGRCAAGAFWALSRYDDVQTAVRDWQRFSSAQGNDLDDTGQLFGPAPAMDLADPPTHARHRDALSHVFPPLAPLASFERLARRKVRMLLEPLLAKDVVDFAHDLAYPLPAAVMGEWLGFPDSDREQIRAWHTAMLDRTTGRVELPAHAVSARDEMWDYIREQLDERRRCERDDVLTVLMRALRSGTLSEEETLANALFFFDAGIVSTAALISSGLLHLSHFAGERDRLWQSPELVPRAIEEFLRFDAPFQWFTRVATRDVAVHGGVIPKGARVVLIWASANRDERRWQAADQLMLTRPPQRHLSFSGGIHQCLGASMARLELRIVFEELIAVLDHYELTGQVRRRITPSERTIVHLPARVTWRSTRIT